MRERFPSREGLPKPLRPPGLPMGLVERVRSWPRWVWFIIGVAAIPVLSVPVMGLARYTTTSPTYCLSCHGAGDTPDQSTPSLVHPDFNTVTCVDCHSKNGQLVFEGYVKGFMAEPERVSGNCTRCHREMTTSNGERGFRYNILDIRITHRSHLERGATCTTCHANVAHDLSVPRTNRPRMENCYTCHAVADTCTKCHAKGIPPKPLPVPAPEMGGALADGRILYLRLCSGCHGQAGDRVAAANLHSQEYLENQGDETLARAIAAGKGAMHGFGQARGGHLTDDQVKAILGYLKAEAIGSAPPDGKALYQGNCVVCHGEDGKKMAGVDLSNGEFWRDAGDAIAFHAVDKGKGGMPAFGKAEGGPLTHAEIQAILDYLKSTGGVSAPSLDGKALYDANCASCHGEKGGQLKMADLSSREFLENRGYDALYKATAEGKGSMPAFGKAKGGPLTDEEVQSIIQYLELLAGGE